MAGIQEKSFDYQKPLLFMEKFLLEKKRRIENAISENLGIDIIVAYSFLEKIEDILNSSYLDYFKVNDMYYTVGKLMSVLVSEEKTLKAAVEALEERKVEKQNEIFECYESKHHQSIVIPDEAESYYASKIAKMKLELSYIREELEAAQKNLRVCRDLKGIISRPNGFFEAVWKK